MTQPVGPSPVVVGVDGSLAATNAALWAVDEAIARDVPLRLVHAANTEKTSTASAEDLRLAMEYAETALRSADAAVASTGEAVKVETAVVRGGARTGLVSESRRAAMVCVGSVGIGRVGRMLLGSTAAALANTAYCPVAIIRTHGASAPPEGEWIAVAVDDDGSENDAVVEQGFAQAALRNAPLLALGVSRWHLDIDDRLGRRLDPWLRRYSDVRVQPVAAPGGVAHFVAGSQEPIQLAVIGSAEAGKIIRLVGPVGGVSIFDHAQCSVLVVRQ